MPLGLCTYTPYLGPDLKTLQGFWTVSSSPWASLYLPSHFLHSFPSKCPLLMLAHDQGWGTHLLPGSLVCYQKFLEQQSPRVGTEQSPAQYNFHSLNGHPLADGFECGRKGLHHGVLWQTELQTVHA